MSSLKEALPEGKERILVVDDVMDTAEVIQRNLEREGYDVVVASNVDEAIEALSAKPVDLVITDLKMPGTSVLCLLSHVKSNYRRTPVIVVSGYPIRDDADEIVKTGVREYITKPFTDEELLVTVRSVMANPEDSHSD